MVTKIFFLEYIYDKVQDGRSEVPTNLGATSTGFPAATFSKPTYVDTTATRFDLLQPGKDLYIRLNDKAYPKGFYGHYINYEKF